MIRTIKIVDKLTMIRGTEIRVTGEPRRSSAMRRRLRTGPWLTAAIAVCLAMAAAWVAPAPATAAESSWHETDQTAARMLSAGRTTGDTQMLRLGLQFRMQPGWKIYWRSPGDAGFPPHPKWTGSENVKTAVVRWPAPLRFSVLGLETLGYKDEVVFPVDVTLAEPGKAAHIKAQIPYLTCDDICIPYVAELDLMLPAGGAEPSDYAHLIGRFAAKVPGDGRAHGLGLAASAALTVTEDATASATASASLKPKSKSVTTLKVNATSLTPFKAPDLYLEGPPELTYSKPRVMLMDDGRSAMLAVDVIGAEDLEGGPAQLMKETLVATLVDGERSAERPVTITPAVADATDGMDRSILSALLLAILGGLILNLMPCVLPVLSIKVLSVVGHGGGDRGPVRMGFVAASLGILFSFMVLATALVALKATGMRIGWGIQFQQPWFLATMAVIVSLFACNLWGFFEFRLPGFAGKLDAATGHRTGVTGHFLQGALATLLATPCSAPFLGTAVGFALARGTTDIYAIFAGLGVGLALPYLAIALFPGLATRLPRPGPWMTRLRQFLGLTLAATAVWLLWVISGILGTGLALGLAGLLMAKGIFLYLASQGTLRLRSLAPVVPAILGAAVIIVAAVVPPNTRSAPATDSGLSAAWKTFDEMAIPKLVAQGKTVLVDVTADWCITCQVNKRLVLNQGAVKDAVDTGKVTAMVADWTRPNPNISAYLAQFGRYGIPFNAVYGPGAPAGIPLPELLTESVVTDAIAQAGNVALAGK